MHSADGHSDTVYDPMSNYSYSVRDEIQTLIRFVGAICTVYLVSLVKSQKSSLPSGLAGEQTSALRELRCRGQWLPLAVRCGIAVAALAASAPSASAQGFAPAEAAGRMSVAEGLEVRLVAAEPLIRQPVAIEFDDRGRLWVIQYLQYPNPAELKRVAGRSLFADGLRPDSRSAAARAEGRGSHHDPGGHRRRRPGRPLP